MWMSKTIRIVLVLFCGLGFLRSLPLLPPSFQDQPDQRMGGISDLPPTPAAVNETINETAAPVILFDSVMLFNLTIAEFLLSLFMEQDRVYSFAFETYAPYSAAFELEMSCRSPTNHYYLWCFVEEEISKDIRKESFEYGAAETGLHQFRLYVYTLDPMPVHLLIRDEGSLKSYYKGKALAPIREQILYFTHTHPYTTLSTEQRYTIPLQDDTVYWLNFFRVNPRLFVTGVDLEITLEIEDVTFWLIPRRLCPGYALASTLAVHASISDLAFLKHATDVRFGSYYTGTATLVVRLYNLVVTPYNCAVILHAANPIGNGSEDVQPPAIINITQPPELAHLLNHTNNTLWDSTLLPRFIPHVIGGLGMGVIGYGAVIFLRGRREGRKGFQPHERVGRYFF